MNMSPNQFLKGNLGPLFYTMDPVWDPGGPWVQRTQHLRNDPELHGSEWNALYEKLASCCGIIVMIRPCKILQLQGPARSRSKSRFGSRSRKIMISLDKIVNLNLITMLRVFPT